MRCVPFKIIAPDFHSSRGPIHKACNYRLTTRGAVGLTWNAVKLILRPCLLVAAILAASASSSFSQEVEKLDPAVDDIVPRDAKLERVATGFNKWTEGPVWTRAGSLLFAEIPANNIDVWVPGKSAGV